MIDEHNRLIDALGGTGAVAALTGQWPNRVSNWRRRGIPWHWRPTLAREAGQNGISVPDGFLVKEPAHPDIFPSPESKVA